MISWTEFPQYTSSILHMYAFSSLFMLYIFLFCQSFTTVVMFLSFNLTFFAFFSIFCVKMLFGEHAFSLSNFPLGRFRINKAFALRVCLHFV